MERHSRNPRYLLGVFLSGKRKVNLQVYQGVYDLGQGEDVRVMGFTEKGNCWQRKSSILLVGAIGT